MQKRGKILGRITTTAVVFAVTMSLMVGCSSKESEDAASKQPSGVTQEASSDLELNTVMLTVDGKEYTLGDLMFVIYDTEQSFNTQYAVQHELYGFDFWTEKLEEGSDETGEDMAREYAIEVAKRIAVLSPVAKEAGCKLTEEEETYIKDLAKDIMSGMNDEYKARTGFTEEK